VSCVYVLVDIPVRSPMVGGVSIVKRHNIISLRVDYDSSGSGIIVDGDLEVLMEVSLRAT